MCLHSTHWYATSLITNNTVLKGTLSPNKKFWYVKDFTSLNTIGWVKISFEPPFTPKNAGFVEIVRSKGDENQATVAVIEMRNRQ